MERQGNLQEESIKKNLKWFLEAKATGKITFSLGAGSTPMTAVIIFKQGKPVNAEMGPERGQPALSQILNYPNIGTYKIETEEPAVAPVEIPPPPPVVEMPPPLPLEEVPTIPPFVAGPPPPAEPEPPALFEAPAAAEALPSLEAEPAAEAPMEPPPAHTPPATASETLAEVLRSLQRRDSNIEAAAVISQDGLMVASILPSGVPQDRVAVSAASIVAQAKNATQDLDRGGFQDIFVRGERGYVCVTKAGDAAYLLAITKSTAMLGSILLELKKTADEIGKQL